MVWVSVRVRFRVRVRVRVGTMTEIDRKSHGCKVI